MNERWPALEAFLIPEVCIAKFQNLRTYYHNERKKLSSFRSGTGARGFVPKWEHFARLQFLDDTIKPLITPLNVIAEDLFENFVEPPLIPCSQSQSEQPQGIRKSTSTPRVKNRKVDSSHEDFYESMQKCFGLWAKKQSMRLLLLS
ncbi:hypothetical protein TNIN_80421 [Trichonephila inaurata madagascariensis]|uniref:MADF domain-containing protein n=1 Tax=Trichonephila inaurata madagascariensis TaxID=2747483 RepID=A0A8X6MKA9_9ARAC|nr:hypothetical protein TNIN_80421 [Trichonephila inaurata madagascariensis]